jgi:glycosyltransferase involved in cell wall biosynthesis
MGVDLRERFVPDAGEKRATDELLFVGRLVPKKGLPHLLDAMPRVLAQRPSVRLSIAGFGPEEASLRAQASRLGIESSVNFLGAMPQASLPQLYRRASVFVAPFIRDGSGNQEGLPVVLMEAIGCGCPVVVGEVAGVHDLLGDAASEVCVDAKNATALATAILATLDDPERATEQAKRIRDAAVSRVDWDVIGGGYAGLIARCALDTPSKGSRT